MPFTPVALHHDHIDGSIVLYKIITELYDMAGETFPFQDRQHWLAFFNNPHEDIVKKFATVTSVLQTKEALRHLGRSYVRFRAKKERLLYVEAKFAPQYFTRKGLTIEEASDALIEGLRESESRYMIHVLPVICIGREADEDTGVEIADVALKYDGEVALDLVCDEAEYPPERHFLAYERTFGTNVKRDCHAGEWVTKGPNYRARLLQNVRTAVDVLKVDGLGHAIPLIDDSELVKKVVDRGIRVSWCPMSNVVCGHIKNPCDLGINALLDAGVIGTINADDDLFMPDAAQTMFECGTAYGFTETQVWQLYRNQFLGAFSARITKDYAVIRTYMESKFGEE